MLSKIDLCHSTNTFPWKCYTICFITFAIKICYDLEFFFAPAHNTQTLNIYIWCSCIGVIQFLLKPLKARNKTSFDGICVTYSHLFPCNEHCFNSQFHSSDQKLTRTCNLNQATVNRITESKAIIYVYAWPAIYLSHCAL